MTVEPITYIAIDEKGVPWVADSNTKVIEIAMDHAAYGWDAAEIHAAHPHLTLARIHAALSYYYDHKSDFDNRMENGVRDYNRLRLEASGQLTRAELLRRKPD